MTDNDRQFRRSSSSLKDLKSSQSPLRVSTWVKGKSSNNLTVAEAEEKKLSEKEHVITIEKSYEGLYWGNDNRANVLKRILDTDMDAAEFSAQGGSQGDIDAWVQENPDKRNEIGKEEVPPLWKIWAEQFTDLMMIILMIAMVFTFAVGSYIAATAILIIVLFGTGLAAYTDWSSLQQAAALDENTTTTCVVKVDGVANSEYDIRDIVPGMVVMLRDGDVVPADLRVLKIEEDTEIEESALTGESEPQKKSEEPPADVQNEDAPKFRYTMLYKGTIVKKGKLTGLVTEIGEDTEIGVIQLGMQGEAEETDLQMTINHMIKILALASILVSLLQYIVCQTTGNGTDPRSDDPRGLQCGLNSVALAVAAVPENLPAALVISLATIVFRLAKKGVIVKSLPAAETLGSCTIICSDKTCTLTTGVMTFVAGFIGLDIKPYILTEGTVLPESQGQPHATKAIDNGELLQRFVSELGFLARPFDHMEHNATDHAFDLDAGSAKAESYVNPDTGKPLQAKYTSNRKRFSCVVRAENGEYYAVMKGARGDANSYVLGCCDKYVIGGSHSNDLWAEHQTADLTPGAVHEIELSREPFAQYRNIDVAFKKLNGPPADWEGSEGSGPNEFESGFTYVGTAFLQDPLRPGMRDVIGQMIDAGTSFVIITGDHFGTAYNVGVAAGVFSAEWDIKKAEACGALINCEQEFKGLDGDAIEEKLIEMLKPVHTGSLPGMVFGRSEATQKKYILNVLQGHYNEICAMTGDGVNDAPALKRANIGVAMGSGTEAARSVADMILQYDAIDGMLTAMREARRGKINIFKFNAFLLNTNIAEVIFVLGAVLIGIVSPLEALQLLILNLLTDGLPAIALAMEPEEGDLMKHPPLRRGVKIFNKFTWIGIFIVNSVLSAALYIVYIVGLEWHTDTWDGNVKTDDSGVDVARTMVILTINVSELLLAITHRSLHQSVFKIGFWDNKVMNYVVLISIGLIIFLTHVPGIMGVMATEYLDFRSYMLVLGMALIPPIVHELVKIFWFDRLNFNMHTLFSFERGIGVERPVFADGEISKANSTDRSPKIAIES